MKRLFFRVFAAARHLLGVEGKLGRALRGVWESRHVPAYRRRGCGSHRPVVVADILIGIVGQDRREAVIRSVQPVVIGFVDVYPAVRQSSQGGRLSSDTFNALLASLDSNQSSASMTRADALKDLFAQIDGNGDGSISKAEFEDKLGAGGTNTAAADNVFAKLDTDGDGSVSPNELAAALKPKSGGHHHAHGAGGKSGSGGDDALMQALSGASSTSATNSDGSTTTTLTYADGTKITMTSPAASSGGSTNAGAASSATSSYNLVEQLIQKQAQALTTAAQQSVSLKV